MATTWNPADLLSTTLSGGNLVATTTGPGAVRSTPGYSSGKYYWEYTLGVFNNGNSGVGVASSAAILSNVGSTATQAAFIYPDGTFYIHSATTGVSFGARVAGDVIAVALDVTGKLIWIRVSPSGNWNGSGTANPATGVGGLSVSALTSPLHGGFGCSITGQSMTVNFGASAFLGAVPAGFTTEAAGATAGQVTQLALEQWGQGAPAARSTQVALEEWGSLSVSAGMAIVGQIALEEWAIVQAATAAAQQYAVSVIT
jgi:hypothetical protein